jgi:hypothetical protein
MKNKAYAINTSTIEYLLFVVNNFLLDGFNPSIDECIKIFGLLKKDIGEAETEKLLSRLPRRRK